MTNRCPATIFLKPLILRFIQIKVKQREEEKDVLNVGVFSVSALFSPESQ